MMDIIKAFATKNPCYKKGQSMTPKGIVVHSTGANNPNLKRYVDNITECGVNAYNNHLNTATAQILVHAFIGYDVKKNVRIAQCLPYNIACWGVGKGKNGSYNYDPYGHIQFEMCEDGLKDPVYFKKVWDKAVEFCAYICDLYGFNPLADGVIVSHYEAYKRGFGSNHGDPEHWFKNHGKTMDDFRAAVAAELKKTPVSAPVSVSFYRVIDKNGKRIGSYSILDNALKSAKALLEKGESVTINYIKK